jgi:arylsulfatase
MIRNLDTQVGELRAFLRELAIEENTILIFMTDNGSTFGPTYYNAGMRGGKVTLWEGGHRVPCFVHWPNGDLGEPRAIDGLTQVQDLMPTLIDFCGLAHPDENSLDGISLAPVLRGENTPLDDRMLFINYSRMPRTDFPTPDARSTMRREGTGVLWQNWRLLEETELYDLEHDPAQARNVIDDHPDIAEKLRAALAEWWTGVEPVANQVQRIIVGSDEENPMLLTACEWRDVFVDQQEQVRIAERKNSYWDLAIERAGVYRFELRRWPRESGLKLTEACAATEFTDGVGLAGVAMPIAEARLMIARQTFEQPLSPDDESAVFTVNLEAGQTLLHTWFYDERNQPICGAYYVYVERLD